MAHDKTGKIEENRLHVNNCAIFGMFQQLGLHTRICFWKDLLDHDFQICAAEELKAGLPLHLPQISRCIDNAIACSISVWRVVVEDLNTEQIP